MKDYKKKRIIIKICIINKKNLLILEQLICFKTILKKFGKSFTLLQISLLQILIN